jgi:diguanylate cyclase (GGDEF)-like protein
MKFQYKKVLQSILLIQSLFIYVLPIYSQSKEIPVSPKQVISELTLTSDEQEFVKMHPLLHVVCEPEWPPFEYYNTSFEIPQYSGINIAILKKMGSILGIEMDFIPTKNYFQSKDIIEQHKADIITGYTSQLYNIPDLQYTDALYSIPFVLLSTTGKQPKPGDCIALAQISNDELEGLYKSYPKDRYTYVVFDDPQKVLDAVKKHSYSYAFLDEYEIEDYKEINSYSIFYTNVEYMQRFAVSPLLGKEAVSVLNKAYHSITAEQFDSIVYTSQVERRYLRKEIQTNTQSKMRFIVYILIITFLLLVITVFVIYFAFKQKPRFVEYDDVTGIPTFTKFKHDVRIKLRTAKPNEYFFLSIDIDNFKYINDSYSFETGNALLVELSQHFKAECDANNELICRFYADNFVIFSKNPGYLGLIEEHVSKLTDVSDHVSKMLPQQYKLTFSAGIYYIDDPFADITSMIDKANIARRLGKENFVTRRVIEYTKEMNDESELKKNITLTMNKAIENGEFLIYYQPKFLFSTGVLIGAEALIRWDNPDQGLMPPSKFIPLFEKNGFIQKIDLYVFERVCKFLDSWNHAGTDGSCPHPLTISFNLSRFHLYNSELINELTSIKGKYQIEPCKIEVELTESVMFDNQKRLVRVMNDIKNAGFSISVDDFGSGYSSLNMLKDMPADVLKLDKEFLSSAPDNERESIIINSVIEMAKKLHLTTVAEGVETPKQSDLLKKMGCDLVQGFLYAKPMPENEFLDLLMHTFL